MPDSATKNAATNALAAAGAMHLRQMVGQAALATRQRLRQLGSQFGADALDAAIGDDTLRDAADAALERLMTKCGVSEPPRV